MTMPPGLRGRFSAIRNFHAIVIRPMQTIGKAQAWAPLGTAAPRALFAYAVVIDIASRSSGRAKFHVNDSSQRSHTKPGCVKSILAGDDVQS